MTKRFRKINNKILPIISLSLVALLIITVILLAIIPVNTGISQITEQPDRITIRLGNKEALLTKNEPSEKADYDKIWNAFRASSNNTVLNTIFLGYSGKGATSARSSSSVSYSTLYSNTSYAVCFHYGTRQLMINPDGSEFTYTSTGSNTVISNTRYSDVYFTVTNQNAISQYKTYLRTSTTTSTNPTMYYEYAGYGNLFGVYQVLTGLTYYPL